MAKTAAKNLEEQRDQLILLAIPHVPFEGWSLALLHNAAREWGHSEDVVRALFPRGVEDAVAHFADLVDRRMLAALAKTDPQTLKVRERVRDAVWARLQILQGWRAAEKAAITFWAMPWRCGRAARVLWRTADRIWIWAGDAATDYNRYTKRGLLCGVMKTTLIAWLNDDSRDMAATRRFLDRRIDNVMQVGKALGRFKPRSAA